MSKAAVQTSYTTRMQSRSQSNSKDDKGVNQDEIEREHAGVRSEHAQMPGVPPLGPMPREISDFDGWREQDDHYWKDLREREVSFRAPTTHEPDYFAAPSQPLDRDGNPTTYSAAVKYDDELGEWVPTPLEEEELLRNGNPKVDPYFIPEASAGERHTTLYPQRDGISGQSTEEDQQTDMLGGQDFSEPPTRDQSPHRRKRLNMPPGGWRVVHLGTSSAVPTLKRNVSSTAVLMKSERANGEEPSMFLVDAGENTDERLLQCDWCMTHGFRWIRAIFITHLHGDHIYGLPMLLANIGEYAQYRRRRAIENGEDGSDPVIRIYGPYGTRGFVRTSLYWDNPVGVRFSIAELVPRDTDFLHHGRPDVSSNQGKIFVVEGGDKITEGSGLDLKRDSPPPHPEEVRTEDIHASDDGLWHVWEHGDGHIRTEVVAAPLRHRMPCFGYVFREAKSTGSGAAVPHVSGKEIGSRATAKSQNGAVLNGTAKNGCSAVPIEIDTAKARKLGVHGTQFRVLRSGRSITVSKTGLVVKPEDVALVGVESASPRAEIHAMPDIDKEVPRFRRKVTILGDTCDSGGIAAAAMDSDLLVHEATFSEALREKARVAMHSTARMAGKFGKQIRARKVALTHFSSRYEYFQQISADDARNREAARIAALNADMDGNGVSETAEDEDLENPNILVREALSGYGDENAKIVAAYDFMEHDIRAASNSMGQAEASAGRRNVVHASVNE